MVHVKLIPDNNGELVTSHNNKRDNISATRIGALLSPGEGVARGGLGGNH